MFLIMFVSLRVWAVFQKTVRVCCNLKLCYMCQITVIFGTQKDGSLLINILASNSCFSYRNIFQYGVGALSKIGDAFLSKSSKFHLVQIIRLCSNIASLWHEHVLKNYKWNFRLPMSVFVTVTWNTLSEHKIFTWTFCVQGPSCFHCYC